ncbi:hypothetical protein [Propionicimonas sp.]|uniref:hypothetical protein n=1 Tax=Propionicimonas sp. TaxID=1955623 RepID=UPI0018418DDF|nr:hypothetical protein [Propionicimonas sp.]MBU3976656.1 hypothetical protein [Actinomycetota bacterium]MBA3019723.1 carboxypeptidase regulatory-like domain-containing protein [Propionicimonas sp.]MBU3986751.1 hypothetical protein [Actinomycetota bacterium]MBU4006663.1 hypothetical protein [Actinomycetota bacterium]MBU4065363.1 hypothetical protein [Actinomycetota bacterium]
MKLRAILLAMLSLALVAGAVPSAAQAVDTATFQGKVTDQDGLPVPGVRVVFTTATSGIGYRTRDSITAADGSYVVTGIVDEWCFGRVDAGDTGYISTYYAVDGSDVPNPYGGGTAVEPSKGNVDFKLRKGASISGRVVDPAGKPVVDLTVQVSAAEVLIDRPVAADGSFSFVGLRANEYALGGFGGGYPFTPLATLTVAGQQAVDAGTLVIGGTPAVKKLATSTPVIAGKAKVGKKLTVRTGAWGPAPVALSYRWYANGVKIAGATGKTLKVTKAQRGKRITVKVTGTKAGYASVTRASKATKKVTR